MAVKTLHHVNVYSECAVVK